MNYQEFANKNTSEKITLAHVEASWRAFTFQAYTGNIHKKVTDHFVSKVVQDDVILTIAADKDSVISGTFFYDISTSTLYVYSTDISSSEVILTFKFFYSSSPITLPHNLNNGEDVIYEPRIKGGSKTSVKISEEIKGLTLIGSSRLTLESTDGYFDNIFEKYVWDNKNVTIYSYNRELLPSQAKVTYRGVISNKSYSNSIVSFNLKDFMKLLDKETHTFKFDDASEVTEDVLNDYQRRIFGKVDGLKLQGINQQGETITLTGTVSVSLNEGTGTVFGVKGDLNTKKDDHAGFGKGVDGGGNKGVVTGGADPSTSFSVITEEFDGEEWVVSGNLNTGRYSVAGAGEEQSGLAIGGFSSSSANEVKVERYNGLIWYNTGNLNTGRRTASAAGTSNSGIVNGGPTSQSEYFNGSVWTAGAWMSIWREGGSSSGTQSACLSWGGGATGREHAEFFNGVAWSTRGSLSRLRYAGASAGPGSNMAIGGGAQTLGHNNERYRSDIDAWYTDSDLNIRRYFFAGGGEDTTGTNLNCWVAGGKVGGTYAITTASEVAIGGNYIVRGTGTLFLSELSPGDTLRLEKDYTVFRIYSDTSLALTEVVSETTTDTAISVLPEPFYRYNRKFSVSPKALSETNTTFTKSYSTTLFKVVDTSTFNEGDIIRVNTTPIQERLIERIYQDQNQIQIATAWDTLPTDSVSIISRPAVQSVYFLKKKLDFNLYTITNNASEGCFITFSEDFEKDKAPLTYINRGFNYYKDYYSNCLFYKPGANIQYDLEEKDLPEIKPRDFIKFTTRWGESEWLEVLNVYNKRIYLREYAHTRWDGQISHKVTDYLADDSILSADVYGETESGEPNGTWIKSSPKLYKILLTENGFGSVLDNDSFTEAEGVEYATLSTLSPESSGKKGETLKSLILRINESVNGVLTVNDELDLKYFVFNAAVDFDSLVTIEDSDVISWSSTLSSPALYSDLTTEYHLKDIDYLKEDSTSDVYTFENEFVKKYVGVEKTKNSKHYLLNELDVLSTTQRQAFLSTQTPTVFKIKSDLRFQGLEIGNIVKIGFLKVLSSDSASTHKLGMVLEVSKTGDSISITVSDLGNVFSRRAVISEDIAPDYVDASSEERLIYSHITDDRGLQNNDENTFGNSLII